MRISFESIRKKRATPILDILLFAINHQNSSHTSRPFSHDREEIEPDCILTHSQTNKYNEKQQLNHLCQNKPITHHALTHNYGTFGSLKSAISLKNMLALSSRFSKKIRFAKKVPLQFLKAHHKHTASKLNLVLITSVEHKENRFWGLCSAALL